MSAHFFHYEDKPKTRIRILSVGDEYPNEACIALDDSVRIFVTENQLRKIVSEIADFLLGETT